jgi:hypothetical protein
MVRFVRVTMGVVAAAVLAGMAMAAVAEARTPTQAEWERAATREATRECLRRERASGKVRIEPGTVLPRRQCVRRGFFAPSADLSVRTLANGGVRQLLYPVVRAAALPVACGQAVRGLQPGGGQSRHGAGGDGLVGA